MLLGRATHGTNPEDLKCLKLRSIEGPYASAVICQQTAAGFLNLSAPDCGLRKGSFDKKPNAPQDLV